MRWHRLPLLLALTGCAGGVACPQVGCVSQLTVRLPAGVAAGTACVAGVCTSEVVDGALRVPLGRNAEGSTVEVSVTTADRPEPYEGEVPVEFTRPNGPSCAPVCVNGDAVVDPVSGRVLPGRR